MLTQFWNTTLNGISPIAHELKNKFSNRWVPFHSYPEAEPYPNSALGFQLIFSKYNQLLSELYSTEHTVFMIAPEYFGFPKTTELDTEFEDIFDRQTQKLH